MDEGNIPFFSDALSDPDTVKDPYPLTAPEEEKIEEDILSDYPPEIRADIEALLFLGKITKEARIAGHTFVLQSLVIDEELAVALICNPYKDTLAEPKAWATVTLAASLYSFDGHVLPQAVGPDHVQAVLNRFQWVRKRFHWPILEMLYREYVELPERVATALKVYQGNS